MKNLYDIYNECDGGGATPGNTMGAGNPMAPTDGSVGSGDIPGALGTVPAGPNPEEKRKKKKRLRDLLSESLFPSGQMTESLFSTSAKSGGQMGTDIRRMFHIYDHKDWQGRLVIVKTTALVAVLIIKPLQNKITIPAKDVNDFIKLLSHNISCFYIYICQGSDCHTGDIEINFKKRLDVGYDENIAFVSEQSGYKKLILSGAGVEGNRIRFFGRSSIMAKPLSIDDIYGPEEPIIDQISKHINEREWIWNVLYTPVIKCSIYAADTVALYRTDDNLRIIVDACHGGSVRINDFYTTYTHAGMFRLLAPISDDQFMERGYYDKPRDYQEHNINIDCLVDSLYRCGLDLRGNDFIEDLRDESETSIYQEGVTIQFKNGRTCDVYFGADGLYIWKENSRMLYKKVQF